MLYNVVSENKNNNLRALKRKADLDFLTGVANRGAFEQYVKDYTKSPSTDKGAFMLIDLDNFKMINDTFGHTMGDLVLKKIADILTSTFPSTTTNATNSLLQNKLPSEHGWFGWSLNFEKMNRNINRACWRIPQRKI